MTKSSKFYYPYKPNPQSPLRQSLARRPGLIIAGRGVAAVLGERRAGRAIGLRRAGEIRPVRLLPGPGLHNLLGRRHVDGVMQPPMPARRHLRGLRIAVVDHPAALEPERRVDLAAAGSVIAIAELVGPDRFAIGPGPQLGAERDAVPPGEEAQQEGLDHLDHVGFRLRARFCHRAGTMSSNRVSPGAGAPVGASSEPRCDSSALPSRFQCRRQAAAAKRHSDSSQTARSAGVKLPFQRPAYDGRMTNSLGSAAPCPSESASLLRYLPQCSLALSPLFTVTFPRFRG